VTSVKRPSAPVTWPEPSRTGLVPATTSTSSPSARQNRKSNSSDPPARVLHIHSRAAATSSGKTKSRTVPAAMRSDVVPSSAAIRSFAYCVRPSRSINQMPSLAVSRMVRKRRSLPRSASSARSRLALSAMISNERMPKVMRRLTSLQPRDQTANGWKAQMAMAGRERPRASKAGPRPPYQTASTMAT
jgi:hypothetical protein